MSADNFALSTAGARSLGEHLLAVSERRQPIFWIALALAATVHIVALVGIGRSVPHNIGDLNGAADAIDVEIIDEAALHKQMGLPDAGAPAVPAAPAPPPSQQAEPQPESEPESEPQPEQPPQEQEAPAAEPVPQQEPPKEEPAKEKPPEEAAPTLPEEASPQLPAPAPETDKAAQEAKKAETKPAPKATEEAKPEPPAKAKPKKRKTLDLSMPLDITGEPSMGSSPPQNSGISRPPGITRSGENDRFGRDVIRALKRTMPPPMGIDGRVTVKIVLNKRGNVASVTLVKSSGSRALDGEVQFAAGQTSFPFPPKNATDVDLTFLVTYIYK